MNDRGIRVLEQYDMEVLKTMKGRGAVLCETPEGLKLLKEYGGSDARLEIENAVLEYLKEEGIQTDSYIRNKEGKLISVDSDGTRYAVKNGFDVRELDVRNVSEILGAARLLGRLHVILERMPDETKENLKSIPFESLETELERHHRELKRARTFIREKQKKEEFESRILQSYEHFYRQGEGALARLRASAYEELRKQALEKGFICHGNFNQHNICISRRTMIVINFEKIRVDLPVMDFYLYMRKILEKHNWDIRIGEGLLNEYERERRLSGEEREVLGIVLSYPEKFWKIVNHYYNTNKGWIPKKDVEKLENLIRQDEEKNKFLQKVFQNRK